MTLIEFLNKLPPYQARMISRLPSTDAIARESGLPRRVVQRMSYATSWSGNGFDVDQISRFLSACGCGDTGMRWRYVERVKRLTAGLKTPPEAGETLTQYLKRVIPLRHVKSQRVRQEILQAAERAIKAARSGKLPNRRFVG